MQASFDRRRVNGPDESLAPRENRGEGEGLWTSDQYIVLKAGLISQANGSAYVETERTKIACAVYGPRQSKSTTFSEKGRLNVEVKFAPFSCSSRRAPLRDAEDRSLAVHIQQSLAQSVRLELLPKSVIDIFITVIESDGNEACVAAGAVAASTALANAGIEMLGLVVSCVASTVGKEIWLDPTEEESRLAAGTLGFACIPALGTITSVWQRGSMLPIEAARCMELCQERCTDIHQIVAQALLDDVREI
ncbi:hypothetical protein EVG20_g320 [Dentipellis fragilis]|uniref:Exoribonuclease phosphorolytic domain-containing protein n=1 Tax=Dentipellis fragilis TaxID=205917 RepID=A0A4Y9ZD35_9AGAM|nr:hypothetical protein EVG20_g320 [Dentipellis fragilis]